MTALSTERRTFYEAQKAIKILQLAAANTTLTALLGRNLEEYELNTTEGDQRAKLQKIDKVNAIIDSLTAEIDRLCRLLAGGGGLVHHNLRRRGVWRGL